MVRKQISHGWLRRYFDDYDHTAYHINPEGQIDFDSWKIPRHYDGLTITKEQIKDNPLLVKQFLMKYGFKDYEAHRIMGFIIKDVATHDRLTKVGNKVFKID